MPGRALVSEHGGGFMMCTIAYLRLARIKYLPTPRGWLMILLSVWRGVVNGTKVMVSQVDTAEQHTNRIAWQCTLINPKMAKVILSQL